MLKRDPLVNLGIRSFLSLNFVIVIVIAKLLKRRSKAKRCDWYVDILFYCKTIDILWNRHDVFNHKIRLHFNAPLLAPRYKVVPQSFRSQFFLGRTIYYPSYF